MTTIVTRAGKGSPLTNNEMDTNLTNLNTDKWEASVVHAASAKTTPVDADEFPLVDSATSFGFKKTTLAALKAAIGSTFATLTGTETLTNKTLTSPVINGTGLNFTDSSVQKTAAYTGFRNRIINGDMRIDQRNAGASVTPSDGIYLVDRWIARASQSSKYTAQQNAGSVTPPTGFTKYQGITSSSTYSVLTGDYFALEQRIEGFNVADLAWGTASAAAVTLSFWVRSSLTGTFGGALANSAFNRGYPFTYTISSANTWEQKTVTIPGDTTGTWLTDNGNGLRVSFGLGVGSTYSGTAGAWAGSGYFSATGATSVVATNGATFYITGVQLEAGFVATPFERRPYGTELALCQRYYEVGDAFFIGYNVSGANGGYAVPFKVTKRATPTITQTNIGAYGYPTTTNNTNITTNSFTTFRTCNSTGGVQFTETWAAPAEL